MVPLVGCLLLLVAVTPAETASDKTLSKLPQNPRWFADERGEPVYLVGDYTWGTFSDASPPYDFRALFDNLRNNGVNLSRVWLLWGCETEETTFRERVNHIPYLRPGPDLANDGKPKFDLSRFNPEFFTHLREVVKEARKREIYLQLCFFDAWNIKHPHLWRVHAFHRDNNVNGVDGDPRNTAVGTDGEVGFCSTGNPAAMRFQKAFVREVVAATNDFPNIIYEIANENYYNREWELELCRHIHSIEKDMPRQHLAMPLGLPNHDQGGWKSWDIETIHRGMLEASDLAQPLILDTDGLRPLDETTARRAAWTAFMSGGHFSLIDQSLQPGSEYDGSPHGAAEPYAAIRVQLGHLGRFVQSVRFWVLKPYDEAVVSGRAFCLAEPGSEYVVYLPEGGRVSLDRPSSAAAFAARWYDPRRGEFSAEMKVGPGQVMLESPGSGDWVLHLRAGR